MTKTQTDSDRDTQSTDPETERVRQLVDWIEACGVEPVALEGLVLDCAVAIATAVNGLGLQAQVDYIVTCLGTDAASEFLRDLPRRKPTGLSAG